MSIPSSLKNDLTTIILAGGLSRRMGEDKAFIDVGGTPLLQRTCQQAQMVSSEVYVVTPWKQRYQRIIPSQCQIITERAFPKETPPHGPMVGLYQGLQTVKTDWVLALACDLPKLTVTELEFWCLQLQELRDNNKVALVPKSEKGWEPLSGFYHQQCSDLFAAYLATGKRSFQGFLNQHSVGELTVRDRATLFNCNTPEDRAKI